MAIKMVVGFAFNPELTKVVLINKLSPEWQRGKMNGVGGKVEGYEESEIGAMVREFKEEAGVITSQAMWNLFYRLSGGEWDDPAAWDIKFYYSLMDISKCHTVEEEQVSIVDIGDLNYCNCVDNLNWMIPLAVYKIKNPQIVMRLW